MGSIFLHGIHQIKLFGCIRIDCVVCHISFRSAFVESEFWIAFRAAVFTGFAVFLKVSYGVEMEFTVMRPVAGAGFIDIIATVLFFDTVSGDIIFVDYPCSTIGRFYKLNAALLTIKT